jgi:short-subunit dehydrogenase
VTVTQVCPGPVATEFVHHIGDNFLEQDAPAFIEISAERCARSAIAAFDRSSVLTIPGFVAAFVTYLGAALPRWIRRLVFALAVPVLRKKQLAMQAAKSST